MEIPEAENLYNNISYTFNDFSLFLLSITHKSYSNENPENSDGNNERLEFLGDAVLDFVLSDILMQQFKNFSEGDLSKIRASLVSESSLAEIARELKLGPTLRMGRGEELSGGKGKSSILSDALEALIAAIYLDSKEKEGVEGIRRVIWKIFSGRIEEAEKTLGGTDFKTELQEMVQKRYKDTVRYQIIKEEGPDHEKIFEAAVIFQDKEYGRGSGRSKKQAEQDAAENALREFQ